MPGRVDDWFSLTEEEDGPAPVPGEEEEEEEHHPGRWWGEIHRQQGHPGVFPWDEVGRGSRQMGVRATGHYQAGQTHEGGHH